MAIFWATIAPDDKKRFYITEREARYSLHDGEYIERLQVDDLEAREMAAKWLNYTELKHQAAIKRERAKTPDERSEVMRKAWATRRAMAEARANQGGGERAPDVELS